MTSLLNIAGNIPVSGVVAGQSLRFENGDNAYLNWTPSTNGSSLTQTLSFWMKRTTEGNYIFRASEFYLYLFGNNLNYYDFRQGGNGLILKTNAVYRDVSAWMHVVLTQDRGNATASNRIKLYVNGEQITSFSTATYPNQNEGSYFNNSGNVHYISHPSTNQYDGYLANVTFIDGQALDPTSFGEYEGTLWKPKSDTDIQSLTFGTNGFYLPFKQTTEAEGFSTVTYTGNGGTQGIEGVGFEPDFVWIKERSATSDHGLFDSVRGVGKSLKSNTTASEQTQTDSLTSFDSNGFSLGDNTEVGPDINYTSGSNYVAWCWDAGTGSAVSNTDGSITSTVKANTTNGFSIVSYNSNASGQDTVGHGLTSTPEMIITKSRDGSTFSWSVFHKDISTDNTKYLRLNLANGTTSYSTIWGAALPTSSVFGITSGGAVEASDACIAYCFHSVSGYSDIGSYTGTGASGNAVTTGFRPAFVMIKRTDNTGNWVIHDNTRDVVNPINAGLYANTADSENTGWDISFTNTGFTLDTTGTWENASGGSYIYLAFADTRDATFFGDTSGNGNNWTPNALNNTDVVLDSPVTGGNFSVMNPLDDTGVNTSEGNLKVTPSSDFKIIQGTIACNKNYFEGRFVSGGGGSIQDMDFGVYASNGNFTRINGNGSIYKDGSLVSSNTAYGVGDIVGIAVDVPSGTIQFYRNGTANGSAATVNTTDEYLPHFRGANARVGHLNFGQDSSFAGNETPQGNTDGNGVGDFYYAPPSGYLALTTGNLPTPTITAPDEYFNTVLYAGDDTTSNAITGVGFQPDFTWIKARNTGVLSHGLFDSVRGANKTLFSDVTNAENSAVVFPSFDSDGFTVSDAGGNWTNDSFNYVAWNWLAGGTAVSNTDGSITSTVSANTDAGFSVVGYTGTGSAATVGHGLSQKPMIAFFKNRDTTGQWRVYYNINGLGAGVRYLALNSTSASVYDPNIWQGSIASNTVINIGSAGEVNGSGGRIICYAFHSVEGYSKIGSYTGNGSTDGTFVNLGFRPSFILLKRTDSTRDWIIFDAKRNPDNELSQFIYPNLSNSEAAATGVMDFLSNGFKLRGAGPNRNAAFGSYIFLAFAEAPFKNANAR